jgi:hypothetical protein
MRLNDRNDRAVCGSDQGHPGTGSIVNDPLQIVGADHAQIDRMLAELAAVPAGAKRTETAQAAQAWLVEHRQLETSIVYAAAGIDEAGDEAIAGAMLTLLGTLEGDGFSTALSNVRHALALHAEQVEQRVLPSLHARLGETDWLAAGDALVRAKHPGGLGAPA